MAHPLHSICKRKGRFPKSMKGKLRSYEISSEFAVTSTCLSAVIFMDSISNYRSKHCFYNSININNIILYFNNPSIDLYNSIALSVLDNQILTIFMPMLCAKSLQSCLTLCNPMDCNPPGSSCPWDSPGKNTGMGCHAFLQEIFSIQELNRHLLQSLHCRQILHR